MFQHLSKACIVIAFAAWLLPGAAVAQNGEWWVQKRNNQIIKGERISSDAEGNLTVVMDAKAGVSATVKQGDYTAVHTPEPSAVKQLQAAYQQGVYDKILGAIDELFDKYKFLGWADEIGYIKGMSLLQQGKLVDAEKAFNESMRYVLNFEDRSRLQRGLVEAYMAQEKFDKAKEAVGDMSTKDPATAAYAYNLKGRLLEKEGKQRDAVLQHLKVIMLFPDSGSITKSSYEHVIELLKAMGDRRYVDFQKEMQEKIK